jgi:hypothetical protein
VLITPSAWGSQLTGYNHRHLLHASHQTPQVLSCEQQIITLSKVCNVNKAYALEHMNIVFPLVATAHLQP